MGCGEVRRARGGQGCGCVGSVQAGASLEARQCGQARPSSGRGVEWGGASRPEQQGVCAVAPQVRPINEPFQCSVNLNPLSTYFNARVAVGNAGASSFP